VFALHIVDSCIRTPTLGGLSHESSFI